MITRRQLTLGTATALATGLERRATAQTPPVGGPATRPGDGLELVVAVPPTPQFRAHQRRIPEFTGRSGVRVRLLFLQADQLRERLSLAAGSASGVGVDVAYCLDSWLPQLGDRLLPLDPMIMRDSVDMTRYPAGLQATARLADRFRGLPIRGFSQLLFYRQDLFARQRIAPPATWEDVINAAQRLQRDAGIGGIAMYYGRSPGAAGVALWLNFLWGSGGELFDAQWMPRFSDAAGQKATQVYLDFMLRFEVAVSGAAKFRDTDAVAAMAQGRAAILPAWGWHLGALTDAGTRLKRDQIAIAPMPGFRGRSAAACASAALLVIPAHSQRQDAAWEYLKWATAPALEMAVATDRSAPETIDDSVAHTASLNDARLNEASNGYHRATAGSLATARPLPRLLQWPQIADILDAMLADAAVGQRLLRSVLEDGARQVEQSLRRANVIKH